jgi:acyl carrier protein
VLGSFPRTSSGKVQRRACRDELLAGSLDLVHIWRETGAPSLRPLPRERATRGNLLRQCTQLDYREDGREESESDLRDTIRNIVLRWLRSEVDPQTEEIGDETPFSLMGLDSIGAAAVALEVEKETGVRITPDLVYEFKTISRLARYLTGQVPSHGLPPTVNAGGQVANGHPVKSPSFVPANSAASPALLLDPPHASRFDCYLAARNERSQSLKAAGLYHYGTEFTSHSEARSEVDGRPVLMLASFSYLGLVGHPEIAEAAKAAIERYGVGCHGVRLLAGTTSLHRELERQLAAFMEADDAVVYCSGYVTNVVTIQALVGPGDVVIGDELNHASIVDGCVMSGRSSRHLNTTMSNTSPRYSGSEAPPVKRHSSLWTGSTAWKATSPRCRASLNFVADITPG